LKLKGKTGEREHIVVQRGGGKYKVGLVRGPLKKGRPRETVGGKKKKRSCCVEGRDVQTSVARGAGKVWGLERKKKEHEGTETSDPKETLKRFLAAGRCENGPKREV